MYYPTVVSDNLLHAVKNKTECECGHTYNKFHLFMKDDIKKIKFRNFNLIQCHSCKRIIRKKMRLANSITN